MALFDAALAVVLLLLAWRCVTVTDVFRAIVLFIVVGLLLGLSWARLEAPDLALAETAIGAGLLGVLLLGTWRSLDTLEQRECGEARASAPVRWLAGVGSAGFGLAMLVALTSLDGHPGAAGELARANLEAAGTEQPVTAVLLNFRSYDTLLEMGVVLMALIGALLCRAALTYDARREDVTVDTPLVPVLVTAFTPAVLLMGVYLVWAGTHSPGGAFQGGATLAGAGVLLVLGGRLHGVPHTSLITRALLVLGTVVFTCAGLLLIPFEGAFMAYPEDYVYPIMLLVEYTLALSIALSLLLLFTGTHGLRRGEP